VNDELGEIDRGLAAAERLLAPGGRLAVVSFHSLEDRRVKQFLRDRAGAAPKGSRHLPVAAAQERQPVFRLIAAGGIAASEAELAANPRSRSARLRVGERTAAPFEEAA
jgi:16S rRNA (cytosine1402-N4)-methyltransferase